VVKFDHFKMEAGLASLEIQKSKPMPFRY